MEVLVVFPKYFVSNEMRYLCQTTKKVKIFLRPTLGTITKVLGDYPTLTVKLFVTGSARNLKKDVKKLRYSKILRPS